MTAEWEDASSLGSHPFLPTSPHHFNVHPPYRKSTVTLFKTRRKIKIHRVYIFLPISVCFASPRSFSFLHLTLCETQNKGGIQPS